MERLRLKKRPHSLDFQLVLLMALWLHRILLRRSVKDLPRAVDVNVASVVAAAGITVAVAEMAMEVAAKLTEQLQLEWEQH